MIIARYEHGFDYSETIPEGVEAYMSWDDLAELLKVSNEQVQAFVVSEEGIEIILEMTGKGH